jgi:hypothetical protein
VGDPPVLRNCGHISWLFLTRATECVCRVAPGHTPAGCLPLVDATFPER